MWIVPANLFLALTWYVERAFLEHVCAACSGFRCVCSKNHVDGKRGFFIQALAWDSLLLTQLANGGIGIVLSVYRLYKPDLEVVRNDDVQVDGNGCDCQTFLEVRKCLFVKGYIYIWEKHDHSIFIALSCAISSINDTNYSSGSTTLELARFRKRRKIFSNSIHKVCYLDCQETLVALELIPFKRYDMEQ